MGTAMPHTLSLRLGPIAHGGFCVARHEGRVVFVRHGLPGELVHARVTEDRGGSFCRAEVVQVLEPSADRVPARCPVSGPGGAGCCDFSHVAAEAQRAFKAGVLAEQLQRIAGLEVPVEVLGFGAAPATTGWRTRLRLPVDAQGRAGAHRYRSTEVVADLRCPQAVPGALTGLAQRRWTPGADLVVAVDGQGARHVVELAPPAQPRGRGTRDSRQRTTARRAASRRRRAETVVLGSGRTVEQVAGRRWELSATGFWQAHRDAPQRYSDLVAQWAQLPAGAVAWDLYSGVGVLAARLAQQVGPQGTVYAVESSRAAVTAGQAALGDLDWLRVEHVQVGSWVRTYAGPRPDLVVLDPPRVGAGAEVIAGVGVIGPKRIIHIGCDPAAFARDVDLYRKQGYRLVELRAFDAFPDTHHLESFALLAR